MVPVKEFRKCPPPVFENYNKQVKADRFYELTCNSVMCLQDPVEQGHNIAKAVEDWVLDRFLKLCKTTAQAKENNLSEQLQRVKLY